MKIAIVNQPFGTITLPWTGKGNSIDIWVYEVARRLARTSNIIVYTGGDRFQKKVEYDEGVKYRRVSSTFDKWYTYMSTAVDKIERILGFHDIRRVLFYHNIRHPLLATRWYYFSYALQIAKNLRKEKCDVIHVINFSQFIPIIRAYNPKIKIVLNMRCEWLTQFDQSLIEHRLRHVDLIIGISEYITEKIRCSFPQFAKRCQTVYNGIDINHFICSHENNFSIQNENKQLLFVGRVSPEKGLHILLEAFQKVLEKYPQSHLNIIGSPYQLPKEFLLTLSDVKKVSDLASFYQTNSHLSYFYYLKSHFEKAASNVSFTGFIPNKQVTKYYQQTDVLVNPSLSESFGRSLIEAMACQVPVVATRVGGMTEIVEDGKTGILVEPGDAKGLTEAILHLLSDDDLRKAMGKAARERAVNLFSWEGVCKNLLYLYKKICECNE